MNHPGFNPHPVESDEGIPGSYALAPDCNPIFIIGEGFFNDRPVPALIYVCGERYDRTDDVTGLKVFRRIIHVGDVVTNGAHEFTVENLAYFSVNNVVETRARGEDRSGFYRAAINPVLVETRPQHLDPETRRPITLEPFDAPAPVTDVVKETPGLEITDADPGSVEAGGSTHFLYPPSPVDHPVLQSLDRVQAEDVPLTDSRTATQARLDQEQFDRSLYGSGNAASYNNGYPEDRVPTFDI